VGRAKPLGLLAYFPSSRTGRIALAADGRVVERAKNIVPSISTTVCFAMRCISRLWNNESSPSENQDQQQPTRVRLLGTPGIDALLDLADQQRIWSGLSLAGSAVMAARSRSRRHPDRKESQITTTIDVRYMFAYNEVFAESPPMFDLYSAPARARPQRMWPSSSALVPDWQGAEAQVCAPGVHNDEQAESPLGFRR
jgi:hypothetical protein